MYRFFLLFFCFIFFQSNFVHAKLQREVRDFLVRQESLFTSMASKLTPEQYSTLLDRYMDRLTEGRIFQNIQIDRKELADFIGERFPFRETSPRKPRKIDLDNMIVDQKLVEKKIATLTAAFNGKIRGDIIDLEFACDDSSLKIPFEVFSGYEPIEIRVFGIGVPSKPHEKASENSCLVLDVPVHDKE